MSHVPIDMKGAGNNTAIKAANKTNMPIHRAIKSQSFFTIPKL